jgi:hypothetical protein
MMNVNAAEPPFGPRGFSIGGRIGWAAKVGAFGVLFVQFCPLHSPRPRAIPSRIDFITIGTNLFDSPSSGRDEFSF